MADAEVVLGVGVGTVAAGIGFDCCRTERSLVSQHWSGLRHRSLADDAVVVAAVAETSVAVGSREENSNRTVGRNLRAATSCRHG